MARTTGSGPTNRTNDSYDEKSIQLLAGLDAVRKRPGMYIGGTGPEGLHHLVWELIDNAVDEAAAGFANLIEVTLHKDGSVEVCDNGRGIPIGKKDGKRTALEIVFTELHAGGKFGTGAYSSSGGLHGVGASVVNALASKVVAEVDRDGSTHRLCFVERVPGQIDAKGAFKPSSTLKITGKVPPKRTGTRVRFWPDLDVFDPGLSIDPQLVREHCIQVCFLVPGLKVRLSDKRSGGKDEEFVAKGGFQTSQQRRFGLDARGQRRKGTSGQGLQLFAQRRQRTQRIADAAQFAGIAQTILESGEDTGEVADAAQGFGDARSRTGVTDEFADGGLTTADQSEVSGRLREPQSQQTSPRGGLRPVDGLQQ